MANSEIPAELRIEVLEAALDDLRWEVSVVALARDEFDRDAAAQQFKLEQIESVLNWADDEQPVTIAIMLAEFAAFVARRNGAVGKKLLGTRKPWRRSQQDVLESAVDVLNDITEGRMRTLS